MLLNNTLISLLNSCYQTLILSCNDQIPATKYTFKLQSLDQGIIKNFKTYYKKKIVHHFISIEQNTLTKIIALYAMWMMKIALNNVNEKTIQIVLF